MISDDALETCLTSLMLSESRERLLVIVINNETILSDKNALWDNAKNGERKWRENLIAYHWEKNFSRSFSAKLPASSSMMVS